MAILNDKQKERINILSEIVVDYIILGWLKFKKFLKGILEHFINNIFGYLFIVLVALIAFVIQWYIRKYFRTDAINVHEIRFYIWIFLFQLVILTFAVLRMYNATVANTSFIIKLRAEVRKLTTALSSAKESAGKMRGSIKSLISVFQKFINKQEG